MIDHLDDPIVPGKGVSEDARDAETSASLPDEGGAEQDPTAQMAQPCEVGEQSQGPIQMDALSSEDLMDRVRDSDDMTAYEILRRRCDAALQQGLRRRSPADLAEEATQCAWMKVWRSRRTWDRTRARHGFNAWIRRIARNCLNDVIPPKRIGNREPLGSWNTPVFPPNDPDDFGYFTAASKVLIGAFRRLKGDLKKSMIHCSYWAETCSHSPRYKQTAEGDELAKWLYSSTPPAGEPSDQAAEIVVNGFVSPDKVKAVAEWLGVGPTKIYQARYAYYREIRKVAKHSGRG